MKKIFDTKTIITFIISGILFGSIGVYAASYYAKDVSYQSSDASWEVSNVNDALNELYKFKNQLGLKLLYEKVNSFDDYTTFTETYVVPDDTNQVLVLCMASQGKNYPFTVTTTKGNVSLITDYNVGQSYALTYSIYKVENCDGATITMKNSSGYTDISFVILEL